MTAATMDRSRHAFKHSTQLALYRERLTLCRDWLIASALPAGGSAAHYSPLLGWSSAYPETTGYIIPTLLNLAAYLGDDSARETAVAFGRWLLRIQNEDGSWRGGLYPYSKSAAPSVFNTGQILAGLVALARAEPNAHCWQIAARKAARWLADGVDAKGVWHAGHYRGHQPTYYTFVTWPMLDYASTFNDLYAEATAKRALLASLQDRQANGTFRYWGFDKDTPAFTHTIAYTIQGFLESGRILKDDQFADGIEEALERLRRSAELRNGRLPGAFAADWTADTSFECVTGSAQLAICLLLRHRLDPDLRLINGASKLADRVCELQLTGPGKGRRGAVPGSQPLRGKYLRFRYPNWAVKFHADALLKLTEALEAEYAH
jgi:hypothetical protein